LITPIKKTITQIKSIVGIICVIYF